jgi:hypothetical protein
VTSDDDRTPLDQLVDQAADVFVYAPIGLFFEAPSLLPKLAAQGRVHARNARLFGQYAVRHGEAELKRRIADLEQQATGLLGLFGLGTEPVESDAPPPAGAPGEAAGEAVPDRAAVAGNGHTPARQAARSEAARSRAGRSGAARSAASEVAEPAEAPAPDVDTLSIPGYDSLSASQVVTRLEGLTPTELEAVRAYESAHRGRKTILNKVAQLQG